MFCSFLSLICLTIYLRLSDVKGRFISPGTRQRRRDRFSSETKDGRFDKANQGEVRPLQEISLSSSRAPWRRRAAINILLSLAACSLQAQIAQSIADDLVNGAETPASLPPDPGSYSRRAPPEKASGARPDFNRDIYYRNKLEFSFESGWLPVNIPLVFDFLVGSPYTTWPLHYTMQPNIASLRWQLDGIEGPLILRGNWDFTFSGSATIIPRGPETRYFAFDYGIRRNFIPRNWRIAPYYEMRGGVGNINAKGPDGVLYAQGQDLTFTYMMGSGARYNLSPRTSIEAGMTYMHVSNAYLSQPKYEDFGINVYGSIIGISVRLGKAKPPGEQ